MIIKTKFQRLASGWCTGNRTEISYPVEITKGSSQTLNEQFLTIIIISAKTFLFSFTFYK